MAAGERLLGIDVGERRIGVAVSEGTIAVPLAIIQHKNRAADIARVVEIAQREGVAAIVVGLPISLSGEEHAQAKLTRRFGEHLAGLTSVPVVYHDERLSSFRADADVPARGRGRAHNDASAAAIILQSWIDARATTSATSADPEGRQ
jgi:putative Holliday junction resolvase